MKGEARPPRGAAPGGPGVLLGCLVAGMYAPTAIWMVERWLAPGSYFSHAFVVVAIAGLWARARLRRARDPRDAPSRLGFPLLAGGLLIQCASALLGVHFTSALSAFAVVGGLVLWLRGPWTLRVLAPPLGFLLFAIPLPLFAVARLTLELKLFSTGAGVGLLRAAGIEAAREGSFLRIGGEHLLVGDACSGLRSMTALAAIGYLVAQRVPGGLLRRGILPLVAVPLALAGNVVRVAFLSLVAGRIGVEGVGGAVHAAGGVIVYLVAVGGLLALGGLLARGGAG